MVANMGAGDGSGASLARLQSLTRDLRADIAAVRERLAARERDREEQLDAVCRELEAARADLSALAPPPEPGESAPGLAEGEMGAAFRTARERAGAHRRHLDDIVPPPGESG
jgi:hypothetical protein